MQSPKLSIKGTKSLLMAKNLNKLIFLYKNQARNFVVINKIRKKMVINVKGCYYYIIISKENKKEYGGKTCNKNRSVLNKHSSQKQENNIIINYGIEILLEFFIKVFVLISVAIICSKTIETVIFYWYFQLLQKNSKQRVIGGDTHEKIYCYR